MMETQCKRDADDDNLYEIDLFREVAKTKNFGIVPVGFPW